MSRRSTVITMIAALAIPCVAAPAAANDWQLTVAPYIWAVAFNGSVTAAGNKADVDASFGDIVDKSDSMLAFNADLELHNGRFGFMLGPSYMNVGVDNLRDGTPTEADATAGLLFVDAAAVVRVIDWGMESLVHGQPTSVTFDAYGGVRYTRLDLEIDFDAGGSPSEDKDWWDPIIGGDTIVDLTSRWFLHFRGDVGGFGAGSNFSALGLASLGYRFSLFGRDAAVAAGYRAIFQDYDEDSGAERFEWDMTIHGPTLGLVTHWG